MTEIYRPPARDSYRDMIQFFAREFGTLETLQARAEAIREEWARDKFSVESYVDVTRDLVSIGKKRDGGGDFDYSGPADYRMGFGDYVIGVSIPPEHRGGARSSSTVPGSDSMRDIYDGSLAVTDGGIALPAALEQKFGRTLMVRLPGMNEQVRVKALVGDNFKAYEIIGLASDVRYRRELERRRSARVGEAATKVAMRDGQS